MRTCRASGKRLVIFPFVCLSLCLSVCLFLQKKKKKNKKTKQATFVCLLAATGPEAKAQFKGDTKTKG
jgi:FtsH-binding integral membrane protein